MVSTTPAFNLKVVLKETGIAADTLRAWERRYGLPMPQRSPGGHRLYSQRDIETIRWLMKRQAEGLSISRAVDLWNEQLASGTDPLANLGQQSIVLSSPASLESIRREWLEACFDYDTVRAEQILNQAFAVHSIELTCTEVMMRGLHEVGELWHKGAASVQQEHFTSEIAMRRIEALISASPAPTREEVILAACPPDELHSFPLLLITLLLRRRGWSVVFLGAMVPIDRIEETIRAIHPRLVLLSAQTLRTAVSLREMARFLDKKGITTGFGGRVFNYIPGLPRRIPAHFLDNTIETSIPTIESLINHPVASPKEEAVDNRIIQLTDEYKQKRPFIENILLEDIRSRGQRIEHFETANHFLGSTLAAALDLGDISYLSADIDWLTHLLIERNVSVSNVPSLFWAYAQATDKAMGEVGQPIVAWLSLEAQKLSS
jgi:DNA-binding transcriptional MerR regulator